MTDRRKRYRLPKPGKENERTLRRVQQDIMNRLPAGMTVGMAQVLFTLRLLAEKGLVDPWLLSSECMRGIRGDRSYGDVVIGNVCHALATPPGERDFKDLDLILRPCVCQREAAKCICGVRGRLNAVPYLNLRLDRLLKSSSTAKEEDDHGGKTGLVGEKPRRSTQ